MTSPKAQLRVQLLTARRKVTEAVHLAEAKALAVHAATLANCTDTVCAYVPVGSEPGSPAMLDAIAQTGARVLLPVARTAADGSALPLCWGEYVAGELAGAQFGLLEPTGAILPAETLAAAGVVIIPALAVDRRGVRLGRGAGFYDRSLPLCRPDARLVAVVRDDELLDVIPEQAHDIRMTDALTPAGGLVSF
ncbi:MAG: 5-formyltetrahydrofolate cyclo-ligase [Mycobacterium sp.]|nr:5-formyltetrahydrofolate cyclo-ligase [Mycobacterium sp.]